MGRAKTMPGRIRSRGTRSIVPGKAPSGALRVPECRRFGRQAARKAYLTANPQAASVLTIGGERMFPRSAKNPRHRAGAPLQGCLEDCAGLGVYRDAIGQFGQGIEHQNQRARVKKFLVCVVHIHHALEVQHIEARVAVP